MSIQPVTSLTVMPMQKRANLSFKGPVLNVPVEKLGKKVASVLPAVFPYMPFTAVAAILYASEKAKEKKVGTEQNKNQKNNFLDKSQKSIDKFLATSPYRRNTHQA